jgi:hypothetical protein
VVADHDETPTGAQDADRRRQPGSQGLEFVVDGYPEGLEDAGGRVDATSGAWRPRRRPLGQQGQALRRVDGSRAPAFDHGAGDPAGMGLFAVATEEIREGVLIEPRQERRRRLAASGVEAHVQATPGPKAKASVCIGQLVRAEAKVEDDPVDGPEACRWRGFGEIPEIRLPEDEPVAVPGEPFPNARKRGRIGVEPEDAAVRAGGFQDPLGVPTAADGAVDMEAAGPRDEHRDDLLHEHGQVPILHSLSTFGTRIPSGPWKRM